MLGRMRPAALGRSSPNKAEIRPPAGKARRASAGIDFVQRRLDGRIGHPYFTSLALDWREC